MRYSLSMLLLALVITGCSVADSNNEQKFDETFFETADAMEAKTVVNSFVTIEQSEMASYEFANKSNKVINSIDDFKNFWNDLHASRDTVPEMPEVDFADYTVIVALMGIEDSGGHSIEVTEVAKSDNIIGVNLSEREPARNCVVTEVLTSPYHIVKVEKSSASNFRFQTNRSIYECDTVPKIMDIK